jgi:predicted RNA-binding Zn-ribbon protein involved in translation (DUF1610 family)
MQNLQIDFEHAIVAVLDACEHSDNVTPAEFELVLGLLKKAKAQSQPIQCPNCGSTKCGMVDYEPLAYGPNLEMYGQYDTELYSHFGCQDCGENFRKDLEISHQ